MTGCRPRTRQPYRDSSVERPSRDVRGGDCQISQESDRLTEAVVAARRGDARGWNVLFERFHADVHAYALARLGDRSDADDVTQETFVAAVRSIDRLRDDREPVVQSWLLHICRHKAVDHVRRSVRNRRPVELGVPVLADPTEMAEGAELAAEMRTAMTHLTDDQRDILIRRFILDQSLEDVAAATSRTVGAVKSLQHRALAAVRRALDEAAA